MSAKPKDVEAGTPVYDEFGSPKIDGGVQEPKERISLVLLLIIAMPRMAINMAWAAQWAALGPYLGTMLPKFAVQLTQIVGPTAGILVGPTIGVLSDRSTNPWGRRRPFLGSAAVLSAVCWILMGYTREMGEALGDSGTGSENRKWTSFFTVFFYIWMDVTVNVVQTPAYLLVADLAGDRQTTGAAFAQGWSTLGALLVAAYIEIFGPAHESLHWFLGMLSAVMVISVGIVCVIVKEVPLDPNSVEKKSALKSVGEAFYSIYTGLKSLPRVLVVYCLILFCVCYGYTAYNGNKGQFFGFEVYDGDAEGADTCKETNSCTVEQRGYNKGVQVAGGMSDLIFNSVGYLYSFALPLLVKKFGAKWVLTLSMVPQSSLIIMAFCKVVELDVFFVAITALTQNAVFALIVPMIIHVYGSEVDLGVYVGALNSANCFGQLLNFAIGSALVETSMGYKLPVFLGGIMSAIGVLISVFFFKVKMNSL